MSEPVIIETNLSERMEIRQEDLITIIEVARIALEDISFPHLRSGIGHELGLSDEELERIYKLIEIEMGEV